MENEKHAVVVVACVAGFGAWGAASVSVSPNPTYASELFGEGHSTLKYPADMTPVVTLTIPSNTAATTTAKAKSYTGAAEVTFSLLGAEFAGNITSLMFDRDGPETQAVTGGNPAVLCSTNVADGTPATNADTADTGCTAPVVAAGTVASIVDGGRKGDSSVTIKVEPTDTDTTDTEASVIQERDAGEGDQGRLQTIFFDMPELTKVALSGANLKDPVKYVWLVPTSRIVSGAFTDGPLAPAVVPNFHARVVITARDSLTVSAESDPMKTIAIDDDAKKGLTAFKSVKEKDKAGKVHVGTVTIMTKQKNAAYKAAVAAAQTHFIDAATGDNANGEQDSDEQSIYSVGSAASGGSMYHTIYDLDGKDIDEGLRGTLTMTATGTRSLFNDGDVLFIDYDRDGKAGGGEGIALSDGVGTGTALSIDADDSESFTGGTGTFKVYYVPGGKDTLNHGAKISLVATVLYSDPSAIDEPPARSATTLKFDGVGGEVMAYAIPHSTNGTGDKGNVRVRCEQPAPTMTDCRVFLECWDDMGMRGFGEAPMIAGDNLVKWSGADVEAVTGLEPSTRHSCRVLSKGTVTVQQLTRDGNSGTLVNNTFVGKE